MKIKFRDLNPVICTQVQQNFPQWDVQCSGIFSDIPADYLVSPANSRGYMCGGIDLAYIRRYGWQLENRVIDTINNNHDGYLAVGEATIVETGGDIPYLVVAPTMNWPPHLIIDKSVVGRCYAAILSSVKSHHNYTRESTVLMSGLGTLTGGLSATDFVEQIRSVKE